MAVSPSLWASPIVVPEPMNGSKTVRSARRCVLIERLGEVLVLGQHGAEEDAAKHRSEAFGPPLVDVVDRAVDFLPPALALGELGQELEREGIGFDQAHTILPRLHRRYRGLPHRPGGHAWRRDRRGNLSVARPGKRARGRPPGSGPSWDRISLVWRSKE